MENVIGNNVLSYNDANFFWWWCPNFEQTRPVNESDGNSEAELLETETDEYEGQGSTVQKSFLVQFFHNQLYPWSDFDDFSDEMHSLWTMNHYWLTALKRWKSTGGSMELKTDKTKTGQEISVYEIRWNPVKTG